MTRQEAIERIQDHIDVHKYREPEAVRILEALDMAIEALKQPEIVRCKDCKHVRKWRSEEAVRESGQVYDCGLGVFMCPDPEDFCSIAERREE